MPTFIIVVLQVTGNKNGLFLCKRTCDPCYLRDCITALSLARQRI